jgi:HAD superfamily hydrolase (TIGR01459 family)
VSFSRRCSMSAQSLAGIAPIAGRYDAAILDLWGTVHDGIVPIPGVLDCLENLRGQGVTVAMLSNAPFRAARVQTVLDGIGVPRDLYSFVMSSGEEAWQALAARTDPWYRKLGRRGLFVGGPNHASMLDNPGFETVDVVAEADFILCTGPREAGHTLADYEALLADAAERSLPMVCANPDRAVMRGAHREICAGAIAEVYETRHRGDVRWHGKPDPSVFETVLQKLGEPERGRVVMVGDTLHTDIEGAVAVGLDSIFITHGIHAPALDAIPGAVVSAERLSALYEAHAVAPTYAMTALRW